MNIDSTMLAIYLAHEQLTNLAEQLEQQGFSMAAAELVRETKALGRQAMQIEGVLGDYPTEIAAAQNPAPCWLGIDFAKVPA
ncbi:hypothetical protein E0L35_10080 [Halomonas sp. ATBC28]|uniref:hypothetical protein n=1 Tax=Halomonas sp. ATBC28 TaxID=2545264 RepID=UPI00110EB5DE|nr:hypothetical protein [Halomonas sp. ATBC28]TMU24578.1 hypothetical protein E0L35_10080 [Halomonas sp. ATBC28]